MSMTLVQPSPELQLHIRKALNENVNTRESDLQAVKDWLLKQPHLPDTWDESRILTFLRGCKFSLEKCKRKLDMYFTMRTALPEFFSNRDINRPELAEIMRYVSCATLPGVTPDGLRVTIASGLDKSITHPAYEDGMKICFMVGDIRLAEEEVGVAGDVYILDASVVTSSHFAKVTPSLVKKFLVCVTEAYPVKLKQIHVINVHPLIETIYNWVKPFLKEKIRNRVHFHRDGLESLYEFIPKDILPEEYGGTAGKLSEFHDQWVQKLRDYTGWFKEQENIKADESKRPGKMIDYDDLFGVDGSFRQLTID